MQKITAFLVKHYDKVLHFTVSLIAFVILAKLGMWVCGSTIVAMGGAALLTILMGILKEVCDRHSYGDFNKGDLVADALGILAGILAVVYLVIL